jgi:chromosome segregation ATPase
MTQQKPNPSAAADKPLSKKLEQIREAIFVWDKWLDKLNDAINEAKKLEAQQTDALSELRTQIEALIPPLTTEPTVVYRYEVLKLIDSAKAEGKE